MNTYNLNLRTSDIGTAYSKSVLRAMGYFIIFGRNVSLAVNSITADFSLSLSNLDSSNLSQLTYDTKFQSVNEMVDKPYAIKGLMALVVVPSGNTDVQSDLNGFVKIPVANSATSLDMYIGVCNSSKTDFYSPFSGFAPLFFDISLIGGIKTLSEVSPLSFYSGGNSLIDNVGLNPIQSMLAKKRLNNINRRK